MLVGRRYGFGPPHAGLSLEMRELQWRSTSASLTKAADWSGIPYSCRSMEPSTIRDHKLKTRVWHHGLAWSLSPLNRRNCGDIPTKFQLLVFFTFTCFSPMFSIICTSPSRGILQSMVTVNRTLMHQDALLLPSLGWMITFLAVAWHSSWRDRD